MALALQTTREEWYVGSVVGKKGKYLQAVTVTTSRQELKKIQTLGQFPRSRNEYITTVDRRVGAPDTQVRYGGWIRHTQKQRFSEVYNWIADRLVAESPIGPGKRGGKEAFRRRHYIESHIVMVNRRAVIREGQDISRVLTFGKHIEKYLTGRNDEIAFVNVQPYARRIERGARGQKTKRTVGRFTRGRKKGEPKTKTAYWSLQAPSGVYRKVLRAARLRWRGVANIRLVYAQLPALGYRFRDRFTGKSLDQFYPTLIVRPDIRGIKDFRSGDEQ